MATAKQRAWRAKFASLYGKKRRKGRAKTGVKMGKRRSRRRAGNFLSGKGALGAKIGMGIVGTALAGVLASEALNRFAPQVAGNDIMRAGVGFVLGGPIGAGTAFFAKDGIGTITGVIGGANTSTASASW